MINSYFNDLDTNSNRIVLGLEWIDNAKYVVYNDVNIFLLQLEKGQVSH